MSILAFRLTFSARKSMVILFHKLVIAFAIFIFSASVAQASAWTRSKNEALFIVDTLHSSNKLKYLVEEPDNSEKYFLKNEFKLFTEYGVTQSFTLGGFFKSYFIRTKELTKNDEVISEKIVNDQFAQVFFTKKLLSDKDNKKVFSFQTSYGQPIRHTKGVSEKLNYSETRKNLEIKLLLGFSNDSAIANPYYISNGFFLNIESGVKILDDSFYNEFLFETTLGFKANQSSMLLFGYDYNLDYFQDSFLKKVDRKSSPNYGQRVKNLRKENNFYLSDTHHQIKASSIIYFNDNFLFEIGLYKSFSGVINTAGANISFWFLF